MLTGPSSRSADFSPQGLFENVFWPFVIHSQIWPAATTGCVNDCMAGASGWGCAVVAAANVSANGGAGSGGADAIGNIFPIAELGARRAFGAVRLLEPRVIASAIAAVAIAPRIQGARSLYLSMADDLNVLDALVKMIAHLRFAMAHHFNDYR